MKRTVLYGTFLENAEVVVENFEEAETLLKEAHDIYQEKYGDAHEQTQDILYDIAGVLHHLEKHEESETILRRVLEASKQRGGVNTFDTAAIMTMLAHVTYQLEKFDESLELYEEVVKIRKKLYGPDHPQVAGALMSIGQCEVDENAMKILLKELFVKQKQLKIPKEFSIAFASQKVLSEEFSTTFRKEMFLLLTFRLCNRS